MTWLTIVPIIYFSRDILMSVVDESATLKKLKFSSWMTATIQGLNATVMRYSLGMRDDIKIQMLAIVN